VREQFGYIGRPVQHFVADVNERRPGSAIVLLRQRVDGGVNEVYRPRRGGLALPNSFRRSWDRTRSGATTNVRRCRTLARPDPVRRGHAAVRGAAHPGCFTVWISGIPGRTKAAQNTW
jgi:hypothetical protein